MLKQIFTAFTVMIAGCSNSQIKCPNQPAQTAATALSASCLDLTANIVYLQALEASRQVRVHDRALIAAKYRQEGKPAAEIARALASWHKQSALLEMQLNAKRETVVQAIAESDCLSRPQHGAKFGSRVTLANG